MVKNLVAITSYFIDSDEWREKSIRGVKGQSVSISPLDYSNYVLSADAIPGVIPFLDNKQHILDIAKRYDTLLLAGGEDVDPSFYNMEKSKFAQTISKKRDYFEMLMLEYFLKENKKVFAICRGLQLANVFFGGTLYQDYREWNENSFYHCEQPYKKLVHEISISGFLKDVLQKESLMVNSHHHQAIKKLGTNLDVIATASDGIVEGFSYNNQLIAVQWHPEMIFDIDENQSSILKKFLI
ncbi:gamma-glutamyl-gamma-aminobutyrate hydrolase family protein [bacterium]|nr:gamma-glutamyl-gamma-aminobutyrate hydrolase family protein [bacterium]